MVFGIHSWAMLLQPSLVDKKIQIYILHIHISFLCIYIYMAHVYTLSIQIEQLALHHGTIWSFLGIWDIHFQLVLSIGRFQVFTWEMVGHHQMPIFFLVVHKVPADEILVGCLRTWFFNQTSIYIYIDLVLGSFRSVWTPPKRWFNGALRPLGRRPQWCVGNGCHLMSWIFPKSLEFHDPIWFIHILKKKGWKHYQLMVNG